MGKLIYIANVSLDSYIEDSHGNFDWGAPDGEVFAFITDLVRSVGTYLYGRRMYETMAVWETDPAVAAQSELMGDFAHVWQDANKVIYSTTLHEVSTAKTQLERNFDPDAIRDLKASAPEISPWEARTSLRTLSRPGSSMNVSCSSGP
jgi:dihydrofolate reductase